MRIDLMDDLAELARNHLAALGFAPSKKNTIEDVLRRYLNVSRRLPPCGPWRVYWSEELKQKTLDQKTREGIAALEREAQEGESLWPRLHDKIVHPDYLDLLLNDWAIHHFHLGAELQGNGFVKRTDNVAFAILQVPEHNMYLLDVETHNLGFVKQELLHIIENNWPHLLDPVTIQGMDGVPSISNEAISRLRRGGVNVVITTLTGRVIAPLGGGLTTAKTSVRDQISLDWARKKLRQLEESIQAQAEQLIKEFESKYRLRQDDIHLHLTEFGQSVVITEVNTGAVVYEEHI